MATASKASTENYSDDTVVRRNVKRELYCKLEDDEQLRIAKQRATKEAERDELQADLAKETKRRKDQIAELDDEIGKMGRELRTGEQERTVPCDEVFRVIDGAGWIAVVRKDSFAEVERRPANAHESQRYLPGVDGPGVALDAARSAQSTVSAEPANDESVPDGGDDEDDGDDQGDAPLVEEKAARTAKPKKRKT